MGKCADCDADYLRCRVDDLERAYNGGGYAPIDWNLSVAEEACVRVLAHRGRATAEQLRLSYASWNRNADWSENTIRQVVLRIRRKLKPLGISIMNARGGTYYVDEPTRARLRTAYANAASVPSYADDDVASPEGAPT